MVFRERLDLGMCFVKGAPWCPRPSPPALESGNAGVRGYLWAETRAAPSLRTGARSEGGGRGSGAARGGPGPARLWLRPRRPRLLLPFLLRRLTLSQQRGGRRRRRRSGSEAPGPRGARVEATAAAPREEESDVEKGGVHAARPRL